MCDLKLDVASYLLKKNGKNFFFVFVYLNYSRLLSLRTSTCVMINVVFLCFNSYDQNLVLFGTSQSTRALPTLRGLAGAFSISANNF